MIQEPVPPTPSQTPSGRPAGPRNRVLIGLIFIGCLALAVPIVGAIAATPSRAPSSAAGASLAPVTSAHPSASQGAKGDKGDKANNGRGPKLDKLFKAFGSFGAPGRGPVTIASIDGSKVVLKTDDGWTRTITVGTSTTVTKGGQTIGVAGLKVGDTVRFHQVRNADGTYTVDAIVVPTPRAGGEVTAISGNSITVKLGKTTRILTVTGSTTYKLGGAAGSKSDIKVGSRILAQGTVSGDSFTATSIAIDLSRVAGEVTAKTSSTITIKQRDGTSATIHVTGTTTFRVKGKTAGALADVAVGDRVTAAGTVRADGSLDAVAVQGKAPKLHAPDKNDDAPSSATPSSAPG